MGVSSSIVKKWCDENITPLAWQRIVMKNLDAFKQRGLSMTELEKEITLDEELLGIVKDTIKNMYQIEIPSSVLA